MTANKITVIHEPTSQKPYLIIDKPADLPSAPLNETDKENAFYQAAQSFPELLQVHGKKEIEHGLLHRLDTATSGLMIIAATQECYDFLQQEQKDGRIIKTYLAECDYGLLRRSAPRNDGSGVPELVEGQTIKLTSYFRAYGPGRKEVRPVTADSNKAALNKVEKKVLYTTNVLIKSIDKSKGRAIVECKITNGYRHQVRCHLAWYGLPIINDAVYNPDVNKKSTEQMHFCASKIEFEYPRGDLNSYDRKDTWT